MLQECWGIYTAVYTKVWESLYVHTQEQISIMFLHTELQIKK